MDFSKLSEWIKLSPRYLFPISLVAGFMLFAANDILGVLGLVPLVSQYRSYIGAIFLLSTALLLTSWLVSLYGWLKEKLGQFKARKARTKRLHDLTDEERKILRGYIYDETRTQYLNIQDGVVKGLVDEQIIYQSSSLGRLRAGFAFNIQPWAWEYLKEHPDLLHSAEDEQPTPEEEEAA